MLDTVAVTGDTPKALHGFRPPAATTKHWSDFVDLMCGLHLSAASWPANWTLPAAGTCRICRTAMSTSAREADRGNWRRSRERPHARTLSDRVTLDHHKRQVMKRVIPLLDEDYLILSTIHSAKVRNRRRSSCLDTVDHYIPSDLGTGSTPEIEEKRRLLYVAHDSRQGSAASHRSSTVFTHGQRSLRDRHVYAQRSHFVRRKIVEHFRAVPGPQSKLVSCPPVQGRRPPVDVKAKMRRMSSDRPT